MYSCLTFNEQHYPYRMVNLPRGLSVKVATMRLNDALFTSLGEYISREAELLDDQICFFVDDEQIGWEEARLAELVERECGC